MTLRAPNAAVDRRVTGEQLQIIYRQAVPALFISVLVAGLLCLVLWPVTERRLLGAWVGVIAFLALGRLALVLLWRARYREERVRLWERAFVVSLTLTGLAWGIGGWLIMPADSLAHQALVYFFLMGMAGGAVASYSAHMPCIAATITTVMLPATIWFGLQGELLRGAMALGGLLYVAAAFRATKMLSFFLRRSFQLAQELQLANDAAEKLARTDLLTGLHNRRGLGETAGLLFAQARRYGTPLCAVMLDIDHFKKINDTRGHAAGDEALRAVGEMIRKTVRGTDVAARLGGEEFAIVLPQTTLLEAAATAERLRATVAAAKVVHEEVALAFTSSFGVAQADDSCGSIEALLARADVALYDAKAQGRNRVVCHRAARPSIAS